MKEILIDTSVWIEYFCNKKSKISQRVRLFLEEGKVRMTEPVKAELLSGTRDISGYNKLRCFLDVLPFCSGLIPKIWDEIGKVRFDLARKGQQVHLIDLWIALIAKEYNLSLFTLDKDFKRIRKIVPMDLI